jgi:hypothetical protein
MDTPHDKKLNPYYTPNNKIIIPYLMRNCQEDSCWIEGLKGRKVLKSESSILSTLLSCRRTRRSSLGIRKKPLRGEERVYSFNSRLFAIFEILAFCFTGAPFTIDACPHLLICSFMPLLIHSFTHLLIHTFQPSAALPLRLVSSLALSLSWGAGAARRDGLQLR